MFAPRLSVQTDDDSTFYLNSANLDNDKKPIFFASVSCKKCAVIFT
jgi:hypothetical protein